MAAICVSCCGAGWPSVSKITEPERPPAVAVFSLAINLLYLATPLYMLQMYDRVVPSSSVITLVMLTIVLLVALLALAVLDIVRAGVLARAGIRLDRLLGARIITAIIDNSAAAGGARCICAARYVRCLVR